MKGTTRSLLNSLFVFGLIALLSACNSSSNNGSGDNNADNDPPAQDTETLSGTAATGDAISGFIYLMDANGQPGVGVPHDIDEDGHYEIDVTAYAAPFMLKAIPDDGRATQYSFAEAPGIANITPMTTLALFEAAERENLDLLFNEWQSRASSIDPAKVRASGQSVVSNFSDVFQSNDVNPDTFDLFGTLFDANKQGFDAVLDALSVDIDLTGGTVSVNGTTFTLPEIAPGDGPLVVPGDWTLTITGTVNVLGAAQAFPAQRYENIAAPDSGDVEESFTNAADVYAAAGISCDSINTSQTISTDTQKVFVVSADCDLSQQGVTFPSTFNLTFTYER